MKTYKIPVTWSVCATMEVEANSLSEAITKAEDMSLDTSLLTDPEYIDGSFEVNVDLIGYANDDLTKEEKEECNYSEE